MSDRVERNTHLTTVTEPDGMSVTTQETADPRFGMTAAIGTRTGKTPSGISRITQTSRRIVLSDAADLLSVTKRTDITKLHGRAWTRVYGKPKATSRSSTISFGSPRASDANTIASKPNASRA